MISSIDIFCKVVDNFGDIGVCWRLARQMAAERGLKTRLYVDDLESLRAIVPSRDPSLVEVIHWTDLLDYPQASDVVIEAFACTLPDHVLKTIAKDRPVWIDLEYLTAEDWPLSCHGIPSTIPSIGVKKTLFFPGFDARTGGLIIENGLISRRNSFINDENAENIWRNRHFLPNKDKNALDICLFNYKTAPVSTLIDVLSEWDRPVRIFQPVRNIGQPPVPVAPPHIRGALEIYQIPFVTQGEFDPLLWCCDLNFVRGEDSFVRGQLAGKPMIWNIYVQDEDAHLTKLDAYLEKIAPFYESNCFERLAILHDLWNEGGRNKTKDTKGLWKDCLQSLAGFRSGAQNWADHLVKQTDLATRLLAFAETQNTKR